MLDELPELHDGGDDGAQDQGEDDDSQGEEHVIQVSLLAPHLAEGDVDVPGDDGVVHGGDPVVS